MGLGSLNSQNNSYISVSELRNQPVSTILIDLIHALKCTIECSMIYKNKSLKGEY